MAGGSARIRNKRSSLPKALALVSAPQGLPETTLLSPPPPPWRCSCSLFLLYTGGAPPSYFDVAWDEQDPVYAPIAGGDSSRGGGTPFSDGATAAAAAAAATTTTTTPGGAADAACATAVAAEGGGGGGPVVRWPALAEEHLVRLYSNDDGCRDRWVVGGWVVAD